MSEKQVLNRVQEPCPADKLVELMNNDSLDIRITCGNRWLVASYGWFTVFERRPNEKESRVITDVEDLCTALKYLIL